MFLDGLKYNYVIFNSVDSKLRYNEKGYYTICVNDLLSFNNIKVIWAPLSSPTMYYGIYIIYIYQQELIIKYVCHLKTFGILFILKIHLKTINLFVLF